MSSPSKWTVQGDAKSNSWLPSLDHSKKALEILPKDCPIWPYFMTMLETPRPSEKLQKISKKMIDFGASLGYDTAVDEIGNVRIRRPAAKGYEKATKIVLQSHLDVVCSKTNDKVHNFEVDPVVPIIEGNWMRADRTTLGGDDGIGVAASMAILADKTPTGQLECLFTVDEETTMIGAEKLEKHPFLDSDVCINVDSEDEHKICVGCAGGFEKIIALPVHRHHLNDGEKDSFKLHLHSLVGGHTGTDIHRERANALQIIARLLDSHIKPYDISLGSIQGGNAPNAIPRDCVVSLYFTKGKSDSLKSDLTKTFKSLQDEYIKVEKKADGSSSMVLEITNMPANAQNGYVTDVATSRKIIDIMLSLPHGPLKVLADLNNEVDTSISFSISTLSYKPPANGAVDEFIAHSFCRSFSDASMHEIDRKLDAIGRLVGAKESKMFNYFPGWEPLLSSPALQQLKEAHVKLFGKSPEVYSIHAGLECGLLKINYPKLDCVSIGPTILDAHSPTEKMDISTVKPFYDWLLLALKMIAEESIKRN